MKQVILISGAYIAAVIGAGFASGSEIIMFFLKYGRVSYAGVILSAALFGIFAFLILSGCIKHKTYNFNDYTTAIMGRKLSLFLQGVLCVFMIVVLGAMIAASGETIGRLFSIPSRFGGVAMCVICFILFLGSEKKIMSFNGVIGISISCAVVAACIYMIVFRVAHTWQPLSRSLLSSASYTCYNVLGAGIILCEFSRFLQTKKQAVSVGILSFTGLFLMLSFLWILIGIFYGKIPLGEIPMLTLSQRYAPWFQYFYSVVLFLAILTTAVSNGFGLIKTFEHKINKKLAALYVLSAGLFLSGMGFTFIVDKIYRLCGYIGLLLPLYMIIDESKTIKNIKNTENRRILKKNKVK